MCRLISELGIVKQAHPSFMFFSITSSEKFRFLSLILNVFNIDLHIGALPFFLFCLVANNYRSNCAIFVFKHKIGLMILVISPIYYRALYLQYSVLLARFLRGQLQPVVFSLSCSSRVSPKYFVFICNFTL